MLCRMQREEAELNSHSLSEREMETGGNFTCACGLGGKKVFGLCLTLGHNIKVNLSWENLGKSIES